MSTATGDTLRAKLDASRKDLLDLGMRNPLLNFRPSKVRGAEIIDELSSEVFRILVQTGKSMTFLPAPTEPQSKSTLDSSPQQSLLEQPGDEETGKAAARHRDAKLQTSHTSAQLQARLLGTYHTARTYIEEQGVNVLFLTLGLLTWYEDQNSDDPKHAPLLLIPVRLERSDALAKFNLTYTGEEIGHNLSLITKIKNDFGVSFPPLPDLEDLNINAYLESVQSTIARQPHWYVERDAIMLGFFSFGKFLMYRDLDASSWPEGSGPDNSVIVRALLEDGFHEEESPITESDSLDRYLKPSEVHTVINADSTQTLAILDVNRGCNLVIQGPPGTGKSQTITNIISEAIGNGKKVLFVSEKMAALEVVKKRLDNIGPGDACLELHSHKTNKKGILLELARTLELGKPRLVSHEGDLQALEQARDRLNTYAEAINTPVGSSNVTPYQAYGRLLLLQEKYKDATLPTLTFRDASSWSGTEFKQRLQLIGELENHLAIMGAPRKHPFWGSRREVFLPTEQSKLRESLDSSRRAIATLVERCKEISTLTGFAPVTSRAQAAELKDLLAIELTIAKAYETYSGVLHSHAWSEDVTALRQDLDHYGRKWWRFLSGTFRSAQKKASVLFSQLPLPDLDTQIAILGTILNTQQQLALVTQFQPLGAQLLNKDEAHQPSGVGATQLESNWIQHLFLEAHASPLPQIMANHTGLAPNISALEESIHKLNEALLVQAASFDELTRMLELAPEYALTDPRILNNESFATQERRLRSWGDNISGIFVFSTYNNFVQQCRKADLSPLLDLIQTDSYMPGQTTGFLTSTLERSWLYALLDRAYTERPFLAQFGGNNHEHIIETFRKLDELSLEYNRTKLAGLHWSSLPRPDAGGEMLILKREIEKKTRHLPIRQLLRSTGGIIQSIKPVFMMSPLSIATFLSQDGPKFDLVVFDEASQVKPVDAFGAILRGKQVVVVGDSKQLPPTSFFDSLIAAEDLDQDNTTGDLESVLGLFTAQGAPQRMLRWHYRSKHESLIAVSNHEFYNDRLVVFPSPDAHKEETGLVYHLLEGTAYDAGRTRTNPGEADAVARAVIAHARHSPHLTLGVAAFSVAQMQAIQDKLELLRREDASCESFFAKHPHEPFFVKNLETVQGDERDVIFISIGYGRTDQGYLSMNFGPLNRDGGERRLNVLITRARIRCEVFTNLTSDDIDLGRSNARGVRSLKQYLNYARTGNLDVPLNTGREADSPFEEAVTQALQQLGYIVQPQVGSAGFFIDMAVVDKDKPGRYLLGIECDGATYHSARSARDRDRLRQQVLEGLGWKIHRIWSTDWFRDPQKELKRLVSAIESVRLASPGQPATPSTTTSPTATTITRDSDQKRTARIDELPKYVMANLSVDTYGGTLDSLYPGTLAVYITDVVRIEGPVHIGEVYRRIADGAGVKRIGSRIESALEFACLQAQQSNLIFRRGDFLWPTENTKPILRSRAGVNGISPKLQMIAPEEIALAIERVIADGHSLEEEKVYLATCQLLGYSRSSEEMRHRLMQVISEMLARKELMRDGGRLVIGGK